MKTLKKKFSLNFIRDVTAKSGDTDTVQEGQHPLTGQCAANFRLLANQ